MKTERVAPWINPPGVSTGPPLYEAQGFVGWYFESRPEIVGWWRWWWGWSSSCVFVVQRIFLWPLLISFLTVRYFLPCSPRAVENSQNYYYFLFDPDLLKFYHNTSASLSIFHLQVWSWTTETNYALPTCTVCFHFSWIIIGEVCQWGAQRDCCPVVQLWTWTWST